MRVLVLGSGISGLIAAHTAVGRGADVVICSNGVPSRFNGAQALHGAIPGITGRGQLIDYRLLGGVGNYRDRVYRGVDRVAASPETIRSPFIGFNIRDAYSRLWDRYSHRIVSMHFAGPADIEAAIADSEADQVFSSIPAPLLCRDPSHQFESVDIWAIGDAPELGIECPIRVAAPNTVICNGLPPSGDSYAWYRNANLFDHVSCEWPSAARPPIPGIVQVSKPLRTNCRCMSPVIRIGRFGTWRKNELAHHSAYAVQAAMISAEQRGAGSGSG